MKNFVYLLFAFLCFSLTSCLDNITIEEPRDTRIGGVFLKIDNATAPANVVEVIATLTRQGYNALTDTMNLTSGTSAEIMFADVSVGEWHLKVDAFNDSGVVVYSGETNVMILEGITTQVTLTLVPTGNGTGSIYILVNWGMPPSQGWIDYSGNPIFSNQNSPLNPLAVSQAKILFENGTYKMWFINVFNSAVGNVGYAKSNDGINWNYVHPTAVLMNGPPGSWDSYSVGANAVIKDSTEYKMYYSGFQNQSQMWHVGLATSSDGINWIKKSSPALLATPSEYQIVASDVIKVGGVYYMFYSVISNSNLKIYLAVSNNGINWERYNNNPVIQSSQPWEGTGVYFPTVIFENNQFKMVYSNKNVTGLGMAVSSDGKNWVKNNNNPFFSANQSANNWTTEVAYPQFKKFGNEYRIYYTGGFPNYKIGLLRKFN